MFDKYVERCRSVNGLFSKGGISSSKRRRFGLQKVPFQNLKSHLLQSYM